MTTKQQLIEKYEQLEATPRMYDNIKLLDMIIQDIKSLEGVNEGQIDELKRDLDELYFSDKIDFPYKRINLVLDIIKKHLTSKPKEELLPPKR